MPALPNVPGVLRITMKQSYGNDVDVVNRWFANYQGTAPTNAQLNTLADLVMTSWGTYMAPSYHTSLSIQSVTIEDLTGSTFAVGTSSHAPIAGTNAGTALSAATAMCFKFKINRRYRGGHPRWYQAGLVAADLHDVQTWDTTALAGHVTGITNFIGAVLAGVWTGGGTFTHVAVSFYSGFHNVTYPSGRVRSVPTVKTVPTADLVVAIAGNPKVASQRRRNLQSV